MMYETDAWGESFAVEAAVLAAAMLHIGKGEYADAVTAAQRAHDPDGLGFNTWVLPELIEAAARNGDPVTVRAAFEELAERSSLSSTEWARGIEAARVRYSPPALSDVTVSGIRS